MQTNQYDIVMFALPRWDSEFSSTALSLARELSKTSRVFYIENPFTIKDVLTGFRLSSIRKRIKALFLGKNKFLEIDKGNSNLINVTPLITLPINFLPSGWLYTILNEINNLLVVKCLNDTISKYGIKDFIFINSYNPFYFQNIQRFRPLITIYHCVDDIAESKYISKHGVPLEIKMIKEFDLTLSTSSKLKEYAEVFSKKAYCLPNAADFKLFDKSFNKMHVKPIELEGINQKIVGYIGSVDHRIDYGILISIVENYPDWILLLVGPLSDDFRKSGLQSYKNVIVTGSKRLSELPAYVWCMDCGIIPFVSNKLTESIYPLKLNEYLAAGVPIVATNFSQDLVDFKDVISLTRTKIEFITSLEKEVESDDVIKQRRRVSKASENTWEARVNSFWQIIDKNLVKR
jgi:teichuronic acid biosynthesis glycosyltransferase TuaH